MNMADSLRSAGGEPNSSLPCSLLPSSVSLLFPTILRCTHTSNESLSSYTPIPWEAGGGSVNQTLLFLLLLHKADLLHGSQSGLWSSLRTPTDLR